MSRKTPLGEKILSLRKALKYTQGDLADKIGVSRAAISQFEIGETMPSSESLRKLSEALSFDFFDFWEGMPGANERRFDFIELLLYSKEHYQSFIKGLEDPLNASPEDYDSIKVRCLPNIEYMHAFVIEIKGGSMAPRYPDGALYVASLLSWDEMDYATGAHMFIINKNIVFRRIVSNKEGVLLLRADATGEEFLINISDQKSKADLSIFKLGQAVHMPPEE